MPTRQKPRSAPADVPAEKPAVADERAAEGTLAGYAAKRRFGLTPEPGPGLAPGGDGPLLFVIQQHRASHLHYDLRLECDGVLRSWAVPKNLSLNPEDKRLAMATEDHPYAYASFEGVIPPRQYGAGEVIVWDCGAYSPDEPATLFHDRERAQAVVRDGLAAGKLSFQLRGEKLKGSFALVRTRQGWLVIKHRDRFVGTRDLEALDRSVLSERRVADLGRMPVTRLEAPLLIPSGRATPLPARLAPMLADTADAPFAREGWRWEPKLDGYRVLALRTGDGVQLKSRRGIELAKHFPRLVAELERELPPGTIVDGEIVAFDAAGKPSFNALQNRAQLKTEREIAQADARVPLVLFAFDLPWFAGLDLRRHEYRHRRRYLAQAILPSPLVQLVHAGDDGVALHEAALAAGFEGVIGKRLDSRYEDGRRSASWIKVKPVQTADFVIGGYTAGKNSRAALGALLVGTYERGKLRYASHVGSGFDARSLNAVQAALQPLERKTCPFSTRPEVNGPVRWVKPQLVAELAYQSWTEDDSLRAPVFLRLRDDVEAKNVRRTKAVATKRPTREAATTSQPQADDPIAQVLDQLAAAKKDCTLAVGEHRIRLTHLDRVYWPANESLHQPAITKRDLLRYLAQVSPLMLPHLRDRPLTMIRMPDGIGGQRFFQKHWTQAKPDFVDSIRVFSGHKDERHEYLLAQNLATLLWLGQAGTLEFHVWHSRAALGPDTRNRKTDYDGSLESLEASVLNEPDYVVFDIDPYIYSGQEAQGAEPELNNVAFEKGKEVAFRLRELLLGMGLDPIVKLSGKTGLHVFQPIKRNLDFDAARAVCELVGRHLMKQHPKLITMEWSIPKRTGKIFMDYNMNVRGKTLNVAYSPRGEAWAPVSMPVSWDELADAHPLHFRITNAAEYLAQRGDKWQDVLQAKLDLAAVVQGISGGADPAAKPARGSKRRKR